MRSSSRIAIVLVVLLVPSAASAQGPDLRTEEARRLYEMGVLAFEAENWPACADFFERSFTLVFAPELLFNVGRCYGRAGEASGNVEHLRRAVAALSRYVREIPEASDRPAVDAEIATLRDRIAELEPPSTEAEPETEPAEVVLGPDPDHGELSMSAPEIMDSNAHIEVEPGASDGFGFTATVTGSAMTAATLIAALVVGAIAQDRYSMLAGSCGATSGGCAENQIAEIDTLGTTANALFAVSGLLLVGTGVAFGVEISGGF